MRLLLDTSTFLWWLAGDRRLGARARAAIADPAAEVLLSAASAWEIAVKRAVGKLDAPFDLAEELAAEHFAELPITVDHAVAAATLPPHHRDPFDRMLVAQARLEALTLVAHDAQIARYDVQLLDAAA